MPILIRAISDPLSEHALTAPAESASPTISSEASRILRQELTRYCEGQVQGRSFLVAGHRGAGKTTMVADAIARVSRCTRQAPGCTRLLPVFLHGPNLFDNGEQEGAASTQSEEEQLAKRAMVQIILGLHRAVTKEFSTAFRRRAYLLASQGNVVQRAEAPELAAQFEIELLEDPPAIRLREFWDHLGALEQGVLFESAASLGQGARELVALNGMCSAHQRISGEIKASDERKLGENTTKTQTSGFDLKLTDVLKPVAAVLSGAAVTGGTAAGSSSLATAVVLGLATALVSSLALGRTSTTSLTRSRQVDKTFIPDLSLRTLDRVLPMLLERLRLAGLAPVLIVDELDKVSDLANRIFGMVRCLKKLVAENVFSCFLTDRAYLEYLRIHGSGQAYGLTYSYFSHTLLIVHQPPDIDKFLGELLEVAPASNQTGRYMSVAPHDDELDLEVLKWILRHRSQLHALALNRELAAIRGENRAVQIAPGAVRSAYLYRIDATLQVAIELQLNSPHVASWLAQRPGMMQTLVDALYYLSRRWLEGQERIDLTDTAMDGFFAELCSRMNLDEVRRLKPDGGTQAQPPSLVPDDIRLLRATVQGVAQCLCDSNSMDGMKRAWTMLDEQRQGMHPMLKPPQSVLEALLLGSDSLLIRETGAYNEHVYRWRYWSSGAARDAGARNPETMQRSAQAAKQFLQQVERQLWRALTAEASEPNGEVYQLLADGLRVLPTTPAWAQVQAAMANMELIAKGQGNLATFDDDCRALDAFESMVRRNAEMLEHLLRLAAFLSGFNNGDIHNSLRLLSQGLGFPAIDTDEIAAALDGLQRALELRFGSPSVPVRADGAPAELTTYDFAATTAQAAKAGSSLRATLVDDTVIAEAWSALYSRLLEYCIRVARAADAAEILCAALGRGPIARLGLHLSSITLGTWTTALLHAFAPAEGSDGNGVPAYMVPFCLRFLGCHPENAAGSELGAVMAELTAQHGLNPQEAQQVPAPFDASFPRAAQTTQDGVALLVRRFRNSLTDSWTHLPQRGLILSVTHDECIVHRELLAKLIHLTAPTLPLTIVLEQPPHSPVVEQQLRASLGETFDRARTAWLYAKPTPNLQTPAIVGPKGPDEIFSQLASFT